MRSASRPVGRSVGRAGGRAVGRDQRPGLANVIVHHRGIHRKTNQSRMPINRPRTNPEPIPKCVWERERDTLIGWLRYMVDDYMIVDLLYICCWLTFCHMIMVFIQHALKIAMRSLTNELSDPSAPCERIRPFKRALTNNMSVQMVCSRYEICRKRLKKYLQM